MKKLLLVIATVLFMAIPAKGVVGAQDPFNDICTGPAANSSACRTKGTTSNPLFGQTGIITRVVQVMVMFAGVVSVIMIMLGGFKYITSAGDSAKVSSAKDTILYAVIGLAITVLAQSIVTFVLMKL